MRASNGKHFPLTQVGQAKQGHVYNTLTQGPIRSYNMAAKTLQDELIDTMYELQETYESLLETRAANRRSLRDLMSQGKMSEDQTDAILEVYPERATRTVTELTPQEKAERAQRRADIAAAKARELAAAANGS
jgi:hypothetical protein